jgi:hypothetical protein
MRKPEGAQLGVRLPGETVKRIDSLRPRLANDPTISALGPVTRSTVLKLAIARGLEVLEREYGEK